MKAKRHETFSIGDTAKITGVSQKQIRNWENCGYIDPLPHARLQLFEKSKAILTKDSP